MPGTTEGQGLQAGSRSGQREKGWMTNSNYHQTGQETAAKAQGHGADAL